MEKPPATIKEAREIIARLTGIHRSETPIRSFLHSLGLRRRKVGMLPAKADRHEQEECKKKH